MLSTVLNIIIFEDCRNQWSMSRPLLGLILLNEKVHTHTHTHQEALLGNISSWFSAELLCRPAFQIVCVCVCVCPL